MSRFRYSGTNWEGRAWYASAGLKRLGEQTEAAYPTKHGTDGTVASKTHDQNSPSSDHRPRPFTGRGVVRGIDIGNPTTEFIEALRASKDKRIKYVIWKGRIFSSYDHVNGKAWTWRKYYGSNQHLTHAHVSLQASADNDSSAWDIGEGGEIDMKEVYARLQASLIRAGYDLGDFKPYLPADDPDSLPGADGSWGKQSREAQDAANKPGSAGTVDSVARVNAAKAHTRLDSLRDI